MQELVFMVWFDLMNTLLWLCLQNEGVVFWGNGFDKKLYPFLYGDLSLSLSLSLILFGPLLAKKKKKLLEYLLVTAMHMLNLAASIVPTLARRFSISLSVSLCLD